MSLFHNVIKAEQASSEEQFAEITTNFVVKKKETEFVAGSKEEEVLQTKAELLLKEAEREKIRLLEEASFEAEKIKEAAQQSGFEEGTQKGYAEGYTAGFEKAMQEGQNEAAILIQHAHAMVQEAEEKLAEYYSEKQNQLIQLAATMAEAIVHQTIDASSDQVLELVKPLLMRMNKTEKLITVTVRPEQEELVQEKLTLLEQKYVEVRFIVLTDHTLEKNGCVIETAHNITDLQIGKQLEKMVQEMKSME